VALCRSSVGQTRQFREGADAIVKWTGKDSFYVHESDARETRGKSCSSLADDTNLTVTWHHIEKSVQLRGYESDPAKPAKMVLSEIIEVVSARNEIPRG